MAILARAFSLPGGPLLMPTPPSPSAPPLCTLLPRPPAPSHCTQLLSGAALPCPRSAANPLPARPPQRALHHILPAPIFPGGASPPAVAVVRSMASMASSGTARAMAGGDRAARCGTPLAVGARLRAPPWRPTGRPA